MINQAYRYNNTLGEVVIGVRAKAGGGYEVVSRAGQYLSVPMATAEDAAIKAIVDPYVAQLNTYNNKVVGQTTAPIDTTEGLHPGDQRRQPAGGCLGLGAGQEWHHGRRLPPLGRDDQQAHGRCGHNTGSPSR